jgi:hypothetical protein
MSAPNPGDKFPEDVVFDYIPYTPEIEGFKVCGIPTQYKAGKGMLYPRASYANRHLRILSGLEAS